MACALLMSYVNIVMISCKKDRKVPVAVSIRPDEGGGNDANRYH
jgi:hypothetical protein